MTESPASEEKEIQIPALQRIMIARHDLLKMMLHNLSTGETAPTNRGS